MEPIPRNDIDPSATQTLDRRAFLGGLVAAGIATLAFGPGCSSGENPSDDPHTSQESLSESPNLSYGVTLDRIHDEEGNYIVGDVIEALDRLPERVSTRLVFDGSVDRIFRDDPERGWGTDSSYYADAIKELREVTDIMGELLDSYAVSGYTVEQYRQRAEEYVNGAGFAEQIAVWEIGNEVNGEWLLNDGEDPSVVADKLLAAYDVVTEAGGETALTFYYNKDCYARPEHEMFTWIDTVLGDERYASIKEVDHIFVSFYPEDCNGSTPEWTEVFQQLRERFPTAKLGFGEVGIGGEREPSVGEKEQYLREYYDETMPQLAEEIDEFVGGGYWWNFYPDMVEPSKRGDTQMLDALAATMSND